MCILVLAGCKVGPDYKRPKTAADPNERFKWLPAGWTDTQGPKGPSQWWRTFNDPVINDLVDRALAHNTDIRVAAAGVRRTQALLAQAHGIRLPEVSYGASADRTQMSFVLPDISTPMGDFGGRLTSRSTTYAQQVRASYIVDVFGKLRRSERATLDDLLASRSDAQALAHGIVAQVVEARIAIASIQRQLAISDATISSWERAIDVIRRRAEGGLATSLDVSLVEKDLRDARAVRISLEQLLALTQNGLDVLVGQRPGSTGGLPATLANVPDLAQIPAGLPVALLERRPDVVASELRLAAATERVGVSIAQMYPDLTLTGSAGFMSDRLRDVVNTETAVYSAVMGLAAPLYMGGRLKAGVRAARADAEGTAQAYAGVVLRAFREVEDALVVHQKQLERIEMVKQGLDLAVEAERMAKERYGNGVEPLLMVLETQRGRYLAENLLVVAQAELWQARVRLFLALGGDWGIQNEKAEDVRRKTGVTARRSSRG